MIIVCICEIFKIVHASTYSYMLIAAKSQFEIDRLKAHMSKEFEMKDMGEDKKILGMEISRDRERGKLWLS